MTEPEENREKTAKTDAVLNRHRAPDARAADGGEAVDNTAALDEARRRAQSQSRRR